MKDRDPWDFGVNGKVVLKAYPSAILVRALQSLVNFANRNLETEEDRITPFPGHKSSEVGNCRDLD